MTSAKPTRSELKRQAILDAALEAFKAHGVQATSMDKLAELAGVSKRTVYNHFASKEALVMYMLKDLWQQSMTHGQVVYQSDKDLAPQLSALLLQELDLIGSAHYMDLAKVAFGFLFYNSEDLLKEMAKHKEQETDLHLWLKMAIDDKRLTLTDVEFGVGQLHALLKGNAFWPQLLGMTPILEQKQKQQLLDETVSMFLSRYQVSR